MGWGWEDGQDLLALALCKTWIVGAPAIGRKRGTDAVGAPHVALSGKGRVKSSEVGRGLSYGSKKGEKLLTGTFVENNFIKLKSSEI